MSNSDAVSDISTNVDLEAVAWIYNEIDQVLKQTQKTLNARLRFLSGDSKSAGFGADQSAMQSIQDSLIQSSKALELVNMPAAAHMLKAISGAIQNFLARPEDLTSDTFEQVNRACFALLEFLQRVVKGQPVKPIGLFPQYRDVAAIAKLNVQPADLWNIQWQWQEVTLPSNQVTENQQAEALSRIEQVMLSLLRGKLTAAEDFRTVSFCLASSPENKNWGSFWALVSGFFDGLACQVIELDLFTKRLAAHILNVHKAYMQGNLALPEEFAKSLLFFCSNCKPPIQGAAPLNHIVLDAVRSAYCLDKLSYIDYNVPLYGRIDPSLIKEVQTHIVAAKAAWSTLCAGEEAIPQQVVITAFSNVCKNLKTIIPDSTQFSQTLLKVVSENVARNQTPRPELALEIATAILYVEAIFSNFDLNNAELKTRFNRLNERIMLVVKGNQPLPIDSWIEDLYRRVNDQETMGNVVDELRSQLSVVENGIDSFLRHKDGGAQSLAQAETDLRQMHGVLSVLGIEEAARAILPMCDQLNWLGTHEGNTSEQTQSQRDLVIKSMSNSLGTLGFLIDMLAYQPLIARKMFVYDREQNELKLVIGRDTSHTMSDLSKEVQAVVLGDQSQLQDSKGPLIEEPALMALEDADELTIPASPDAPTVQPAVTSIFDSLPDLSLESSSPPAKLAVEQQPLPSTQYLPSIIDSSEEDDDFGDDLREVFLEEAHEIIANIHKGLISLKKNQADREALTSVRREFHTLKGSARMVGLMDFASAAWACEQCFNAWLTENKPASEKLVSFTDWAANELEAWAKSLQQDSNQQWSIALFEEKAQEASVEKTPEQPDDALALTAELLPADLTQDTSTSGNELDATFMLDLNSVDKNVSSPPTQHKKSADDALYSSWASENWSPSKSLEHTETTLQMQYPEAEKNVEAKVAGSIDSAGKHSLFPPTEWFTDTQQITQNTVQPDRPSLLDIAPQDEDVALEGTSELTPSTDELHDAVKIIGPLKVSTPLYEVYIEEAQTRAEKLKEFFAQWQENGEPAALKDAQILAHALAGSSATVGFVELAGFAKALEYGIEHYRQTALQADVPADRSVTLLFGQIRDEIARLLQQFAKGQLDAPQSNLLEQIQQFKQLDFAPVDTRETVDFAPSDNLELANTNPESADLANMELTESDDVVDLGDADDDVKETVVHKDELLSKHPQELEISPEMMMEFESESIDIHEDKDTDRASQRIEPVITVPVQAPTALSILPELDREAVVSEVFEIFEEEANDLLPRIAEGLREWFVAPKEDQAPLLEVLRVLHTLKGSARLAGAMRLGDMTHNLESALKEVSEEEQVSLQQEHDIFDRFDAIENEFETLCYARVEALGTPAAAVAPVAPVTPVAPPDTTDETQAQNEQSVLHEQALPQELLLEVSKPIPSEPQNTTGLPENLLQELAFYKLSPTDRKAAFNELFDIFKEESAELLQIIQKELRSWQAASQHYDTTEVLRTLHTFKGSARLVGAMALGTTIHDLETALKETQDRLPTATEAADVQDLLTHIETTIELLGLAEQEVKNGLVGTDLQDLPEVTLPLSNNAVEETQETHVNSALESLEPTDAAIVGSEIFPAFAIEANRTFPIISSKIKEWTAQTDSFVRLVEGLRLLHTLHDNIKLAGIERLGIFVNSLSQLLKELVAINPTSEQLLEVNNYLVQIEDELGKLCAAAEELHQISLQAQADSIAAEQAHLLAQQLAAAQEEALQQEENQLNPQFVSTLKARVIKPTIARPLAPTGSGQLIRVRAALIDELVTRAGEVNMLRSQLAAEVRQLKEVLSNELVTNLERLQMQLRDIEVQSETQMASRMDAARLEGQQFDPLEFDRYTRVQEITRMMAESVNDVGTVQKTLMQTSVAVEDGLAAQARSARDLQYTLLRARMIDFSSVAERFHRIVRLVSKECNKQSTLTIEGGDIEIDRAVLDHIAPAFEHILRNCVVHGIENAQRRQELGKPAFGQITIKLAQEGNDVSVTIADDGSGLDLQKIREKAQKMNLIASDSQISDHDLAQMIYKSGLTTTTQVTELAGRGVGLDMANSEVVGLGGRIEVFTKAGQGTEFKMVLPLTTAVTQVAMVSVSGKTFGIPVSLIESIQRFSNATIAQTVQSGKIEHQGEQLPAFWFAGLLNIKTDQFLLGSRNLQWLILRSAGQRIAIAVDFVIGSQEVVIKNVGPQFAHLTGFSGLTVLSGGRIVLMYNPVALARVFAQKGQLSSIIQLPQTFAPDSQINAVVPPALTVPITPRSNKVLVVDDSLTVRRVTQRLLERSGFDVVLAKDGQDALDKIAHEIPALMLSDIEMPKMDGFELVRQVRSKSTTKNLPIIMITSRIAQKHHDYAKELGVNHYLGKPFGEEELLKLVHTYVKRDNKVPSPS